MNESSRLVLLLTTLSLASCSPMLGSGQCSWGPSYWCANIPQASECGAVRHCITAVWEKETVPQDDDEVCKICKDMVGQARDTLLSNETQEELREVFDGSCDLIPIKIVAKECRTLSDQFIPELVETLASEMNPDTVCTVSGLCNSARIDKLLEEQRAEPQFGGDCNICRKGAKEVKARLARLDQKEVEDKAVELCGLMGSFSTACMETVIEQSDELYKLLTEQFDEEICDLSGLCSQSFDSVPATKLQAGEDIQCEFCEKVIQHWLDVYASNTSLNEFKALLDGVCEKLDKNNADHCKHIVDDYYIPAFQFIRTQLKPHMLCSLVGLCPANNLHTSKTPISMAKLLPAQREKFSALNGPLYVSNSYIETSTPSCVMCEYVINTLEKYVKDKQNEEEIKKALETLCDKMPGSVRDKCNSLVDTYEPAIIELLINNVDPEQICSMLHLCDQENTVRASPHQHLSKDSNCEMCEFAMNEVFSILKDKDDQDMVKNVLESICYRLPNSVERSCEDFVEKYTAKILNFIVQGLTPDEICSALKLCTTQASPVTPSPDPSPVTPVTADTTCVLCEYVITTLDSMLQDKTNEAEIKTALENLCSLLPSSVEKQCDTFVDTYTDLIIDMLTKDVSPEMICSNLGLCKTVSNIVQHQVEMISQDKTGPYCALCKMLVQNLDSMLQDKHNEQEIEEALSVVCYKLSDPVHKQCEKMVAKYTEKIIDMFVADYTPDMICSELAMCVDNQINSNSIDYHEEVSDDVVEVRGGENIGCEICEFAMSIIDQRLTNPDTVDNVERIVQFMCSYLPGSIADKCEEFVDEYGQMIMDALVNDELKPEQVCGQLIPECAEKTPTNINKNKCVWGPSYWCSSPFHASACGTVELCRRTVWKNLGLN